ncbi:MAG: hypothetical protein LBK83_13100 [Treponema sp.]|jgi:hypothetical protein|nr:hypothetical protein [Treponema sp.]
MMFDFEHSQRERELLQRYHVLQNDVERLYREGDYKAAKKVCLDILKDIKALKETRSFDDINKPFADCAILMLFPAGVDDSEKEILKTLFSNNIIDMKYVSTWFGEINPFKKIEYAEQTFNFFNEIGVLTQEEAEAFIENARENNGEVILPDPDSEKGLKILEQRMLDFLAANQPILQKEFIASFRVATPNMWEGVPGGVGYTLEGVFYGLLNDGKIRREKAGRSFNLFVA